MTLNAKISLFNIFDDSVIEHIFNYLDIYSQVKMTETCKRFLTLRKYITELHATPTMTNSQLRLYRNIKKLYLHKNNIISNGGIKNLHLEVLHIDDNTKITDECLHRFNLIELHCGYVSEFYSDVFDNNPLIEWLSCGNSKDMRIDFYEHSIDFYVRPRDILPNLKYLSYDSTELLGDFLERTPNLEILRCCYGMVHGEYLRYVPKLRELHCFRTTYISESFEKLLNDEDIDEYYDYVNDDDLANLPQLQILHACEVMTSNCLEYVPDLRELYCYNSSIGDEGLKYVPKLKILRCDMAFITDDGISFLPELEELHCVYNSFITDRGICQLQNLKKLVCGTNKYISLNGISTLKKLRELSCGMTCGINKYLGCSNPNLIKLHCDLNKNIPFESIGMFEHLDEMTIRFSNKTTIDDVCEILSWEKRIRVNVLIESFIVNKFVFIRQNSYKYRIACKPKKLIKYRNHKDVNKYMNVCNNIIWSKMLKECGYDVHIMQYTKSMFGYTSQVHIPKIFNVLNR